MVVIMDGRAGCRRQVMPMMLWCSYRMDVIVDVWLWLKGTVARLVARVMAAELVPHSLRGSERGSVESVHGRGIDGVVLIARNFLIGVVGGVGRRCVRDGGCCWSGVDVVCVCVCVLCRR